MHAIIGSTMTTAAIQPLHGWTEQQLESLPHLGKVEIINGKIVMSPANFHHGFISSIILSRLLTYSLEHNIGMVVDSSTGFRLKNENVLSPAVSFVSLARLASMPQPLRGFYKGAPDLAVEVLSPADSLAGIDDKIREYFENGTRLVWIVDTLRRTIDIRRSAGDSLLLHETDTLSGEDVLPGFALPLSDIFRPYPKP